MPYFLCMCMSVFLLVCVPMKTHSVSLPQFLVSSGQVYGREGKGAQSGILIDHTSCVCFIFNVHVCVSINEHLTKMKTYVFVTISGFKRARVWERRARSTIRDIDRCSPPLSTM